MSNPRWGFGLVAGLVAAAPACKRESIDLTGLRCDDGQCLDGFVCHPERDICVAPVQVDCAGGGVCPSQVATGDPCSGEGSFIPCVDGVEDCSQGCRTCEQGRWSDCSLTACSGHDECGLCQECGVDGFCVDQGAGSDVKGECSDGLYCNGLESCNGRGACVAGVDPCAGRDCDEATDSCTCSSDDHCPVCQVCNLGAGLCEPQAAGQDEKNECSIGPCLTGVCDGDGACAVVTPGTGCGTCQSCNTVGACADDLGRDADCGSCQECAAGGSCVPQLAGEDVKGDCEADGCRPGDCDGFGACAIVTPGTDCGTCQSCDEFGACADDLDQHTDCGFCQRCAAGGGCEDQPAGSDLKGECADTTYCNGLETCDGDGGCQAGTNPCPSLPCNEAEGSCTCTVNADCPLCQRCNSGGLCVDQNAGDDLKDECAADLCRTGSCDGDGACDNLDSGTDCGTCRCCNANGGCVANSSDHADCPLCEKCVAGACQDQTSSEDLKNECSPDPGCGTGNCNNAGACAFATNNTDCGTCRRCNANGACLTNSSDHADCPVCEKCVTGACQDQTSSEDLKNDCTPDTGCGTGTCDGTGACDYEDSGQDCGVCRRCNTTGACVANSVDHADCSLCFKCVSGSCGRQTSSEDLKNECDPDAGCGSGNCDGGGDCDYEDSGTDCGICQSCNATGDCGANSTDHTDCPLCQKCVSGACQNQTSSEDLKNQCSPDVGCGSGDCDGGGDCDYEDSGTACGTCRRCSDDGQCDDDLTRHGDCGSCEQCVAGGACDDQPPGSDLKNNCDPDVCNTGSCDGAGACGIEPACLLPSSLALTATSPVSLCSSSTLTIDLDGYTGAAADLSCTAPAIRIPAGSASGVATFEGDDQGWTPSSAGRQDWRGGFPSATCPADGSGQFIRFDNGTTGTLTRTFDVTGYRNLTLSFRAGYDDGANAPEANEHISVQACCGASCAFAEVFFVPNGSETGGSNGCRMVGPTALGGSLDNCVALRLRFSHTNSGVGDEYAAVDDVELTGELVFAAISDSGGGLYTSAIRSCVPASPTVTCTWDDGTNPPLTDDATVVFQ